MPEEIALVFRSTGDTPDRIGRVSNIKNRPQHEAGSGTARDRDGRTNQGENTMEQQTRKPIKYSAYDAHCARTGCQCEHTQCYKGWINHTETVWPCMYCREDLTGRLMRVAQARDKGYPQEALSRIMMGKPRDTQ